MYTHPPWLRPLRQAIRVALVRLHQSLARLTLRVRETVVEAVAQAAAEVVRQASVPLLPLAEDLLERGPGQRQSGAPRFWEDDRAHHDPYGHSGYGAPAEPDWEDYEAECEAEETPAAPSRLQAALATGCRVTVWLLNRGGPRPVARALGAGLLTALAAFGGGPMVAAGVGLVGSAATWLSLNAG